MHNIQYDTWYRSDILNSHIFLELRSLFSLQYLSHRNMTWRVEDFSWVKLPWDEETHIVLMEIKWPDSAFWKELSLAPSLQKDLAGITSISSSCAIWNMCPKLAGSFLNLFIPGLAQLSFICDFGVYSYITPWFRLEIGTCHWFTSNNHKRSYLFILNDYE